MKQLAGVPFDAVAGVRDIDAGAAGEIPDSVLVARVLLGDRAAFELLVRRHQASLYRHARAMGLDADMAAEMVQGALVKAYESLGSCRDRDRFGVWAARILRNRCLDFLKSSARRWVPLPATLPASGGNPELEEERRALRRRLNEALEALPADQREAFLMKHGEGRSYDEMAELTGTSVSAMKMRVHRAREALRSHLRLLGIG